MNRIMDRIEWTAKRRTDNDFQFIAKWETNVEYYRSEKRLGGSRMRMR